MSETTINKEPIAVASAVPPQNTDHAPAPPKVKAPEKPLEIGGPAGLEPTRYGDWERRGRCIDF